MESFEIKLTFNPILVWLNPNNDPANDVEGIALSILF